MADERIDEIIAEFLEAEAVDRPPDRAALLARHPDLADELRSFFADHDRMRAMAEPLQEPAPGEAPTLGLDAPLSPGTTVRYFGDYEILAEIARGGMGVVYKARQVSLNRVVALKMILAGQLASPADVQRFHAEAEAAANLDHPNIVPIYEVGEHEGQHYFSMKLIEGGSLSSFSGEPKASAANQRRAARLLATVARAVHHAHQRGVIHRDLKPANILLDEKGEPHVTDFGLARRVKTEGGATATGSIVGTPAYMAPEQARAEKGLTTSVDVYSLGAILYELQTSQPPYRGATPLDVLMRVLDTEPRRPRALNPAIDHDLETICLKCLAKEPARRYGSAEALAADLEHWLRGEPIVARRTMTWERAVKWVRRRPAIAGLLALIACLAVGGGGAIGYFALDAQAARTREADARANEAEERLRRAQDNERATQVEREQVDSTLAQILARPLGYQDGPLSVSELDALWEVARTKSDRVRLLFFDLALASPESAARLQRRADLAVQAAVGLDAGRSDRLRALLLHKLRDDHEDPGVREASATLGVVLGNPDEAFTREACLALLAAMARTTDAGALNRQARGVAILTACLPPAEAARICAPEAQHLLELMAKTTDADTLSQLGQALGELGQRLGPDDAARLCAKGVQQVLDLLPKTTDLEALSRLGQSLGKLAECLAADEAAKACTVAVLAILDRLADKLSPKEGNFNIPLVPVLYTQQALERLAKRLGPDDAARAAQHALSLIGGKRADFLAIGLGPALEKLAERLGPDEAAKEARQVLDLIIKEHQRLIILAALGKALVKLSLQLKPGECAKATEIVLKLMDTTTEPVDLSQLADVVASLAKRLPPDEAARVCRQAMQPLLGHMAKSPKMPTLAMLAAALGTVAEQLPPDEAGRVCGQEMQPLLQLLAEANDRETLYWLGPALGALAQRLLPEEAAPICGQATRTLLGVLADIKKDDPFFRFVLASSLSVLAERLPPEEAARVSAKAMQTLLDVLDKTTEPTTLSQLAPPLGKMAEQLAPEESAKAAQQVFQLTAKITEPITLAELEKAVSKLAERCGEQDQIELLKHPLCVGANRDAVRIALNKRLKQNFATQWQLIAWLRQHRPDLDLISPP
jgi:hypothetical protein